MAEESNPKQPQTEASTMARRKFATPPVKVACLSCRASRTRCDGGRPACASCVSKDRQCVYKPSRRGGPRTRKKPQPLDSIELAAAIPEPKVDINLNLTVENYIQAGAGLKNLTEVLNDSDALFDSLFVNEACINSIPEAPLAVNPIDPMVRTYATDAAILNAYYIWIHPYFPILPPPAVALVPDQVVPLFQNRPKDVDEPSSPVALAISAILALIPCPVDANHLAEESVLFRRKYAQFLAQSVLESMEVESERPESAVEPHMALEDSDDEFARPQFHLNVPLELESIIALDLLSIYEYAQRGNLKKMKSRASAALMSAMNLSLHMKSEQEDRYSEARRRVWWMTYTCICQSNIVSNTHPAFDIFSPTFTADFPIIKTDPEAWPLFVKSQQAILSATQFVIELNKAMKLQADMAPIYKRMTELENYLEPLVTESESWMLSNNPSAPLVNQHEAVVAQSMRYMARIKLNSARIKVHRYCAFFDLPVFPRKNCDLQASSGKDRGESQELQHWPSCCSYLSHTPPASSPSIQSTPKSDGGASYQQPPALIFPFSSHQSARICLKSALNIGQAFDSLPYPNPSAQPCEAPSYLGLTSLVVAPRTMPSFACCAMQCAYVLLMVYDRTKSMYPPSPDNDSVPLANSLLGRLQQGLLSILNTLENYGSAFEALSGMRDQIRDKVYSTMTFQQ